VGEVGERKERKGGGGRTGKGEVCVMGLVGWTPLYAVTLQMEIKSTYRLL